MKNTFYILLLSILFSACEIVVDLEIPEHKPVLVLNSVLNPDSIFKLRLSHSVGSFDNNPITEVKNATIGVYQNNNFMGEMSNVFQEMSDGYYDYYSDEYREPDSIFAYTLNAFPLAQSTYTFKVSHSSFENIEASSALTSPVNIESLEIVTSLGDEYSTLNKVSVRFLDPSGASFYLIRIINKLDDPFSMGSTKTVNFNTTDPSILSSSIGGGDAANDASIYLSDALFDDALFEGELKTVNLEFHNWNYFDQGDESTDSYYLQFSTISKDYFEYLTSYQAHSNYSGGGLFAGEPVQVFTNVQNGLGIFGSSNTQSIEMILSNFK